MKFLKQLARFIANIINSDAFWVVIFVSGGFTLTYWAQRLFTRFLGHKFDNIVTGMIAGAFILFGLIVVITFLCAAVYGIGKLAKKLWQMLKCQWHESSDEYWENKKKLENEYVAYYSKLHEPVAKPEWGPFFDQKDFMVKE